MGFLRAVRRGGEKHVSRQRAIEDWFTDWRRLDLARQRFS
jgi:hypothetical protein